VTPERKQKLRKVLTGSLSSLAWDAILELIEEVERLELVALEYKTFQAGASCIRQEQQQLMDALDLALKEVNRLDALNQSMARQVTEQDTVLVNRIVALEEAIDRVVRPDIVGGPHSDLYDLYHTRWT
jgi:pyruvate/2-oxoglutarate/acetoin dehydrogenase E1 component